VLIDRVPVVQVKTPTGAMRVSTAEATAIDLVRYGAVRPWLEALKIVE
jgi:hypothetical protein